MTLKPCQICGEPSEATRCAEHTAKTTTIKPRAKTAARGYNESWNKLSKRARRLQPWCSDCGATERLTADHSPEAWQRVEEGKPITLDLIDVVCGPCNNRRGPARGRGVRRRPPDRSVKPQTELTLDSFQKGSVS